MLFPRLSQGRWSSRLGARHGGRAVAAAARDRGRTAAAAAIAPRPIELLEPRVLLSVSMDSDGWTVVGKSRDTRVIYVSSSDGRDSNSGRSATRPVRTLAKAMTLVRSGKRVDTPVRRPESLA